MLNLMMFAILFAQVLPDTRDQVTPYTRRAAMERVVARLGPDVRPFVEEWGDDAVKALNKCSPDVSKRLSKLDIAAFSHPRSFLLLVGKHGNDVCLYGLDHAEELKDRDALDAFCFRDDCLEYALGLKNISQGKVERRAVRLAYAESQKERSVVAPQSESSQQYIPLQLPVDKDAQMRAAGWLAFCGVVLIFGVWWWKKRNAAM